MTENTPDTRPVHKAACHCGAVRFNVKLTDGLRSARRCNCSYCRMRGAVAVSANLADIQVEQGQDALTLYQFNTGQARHYFCSHCGIYTFHQRRSNPEQYGVNVACIEGMSPFDFEEVPVSEGRSHPKDRPGGGSVIAGWVRYQANPQAQGD
ncbi:GFA family protein [Alcaligenes faecalis]|uniref:GFA family protein n=1 Tax=Alcaligenes faecalis TaxID=511 RepID=UPI001292DEA7|nr:GFA family protein [Alcaligenes faecalis]QFY76193.1 GFA family protein [Alcaligenes faecalis]